MTSTTAADFEEVLSYGLMPLLSAGLWLPPPSALDFTTDSVTLDTEEKVADDFAGIDMGGDITGASSFDALAELFTTEEPCDIEGFAADCESREVGVKEADSLAFSVWRVLFVNGLSSVSVPVSPSDVSFGA